MSSIHKLKGFYDLFSPQSDKYSLMEDKAKKVFSCYGFKELRIPLLEPTELFARSIGSDTDVVQKEMFSFPDRKGRSISLRPEATAGVVRAYLEAKLYNIEQVSKLFTFGPMFRYERPQKGRQRQFHQINVEVFGTSAPQADTELMLMLQEYLLELKLSNLSFEINTLGCEKCRPAFQESLSNFISRKPLDKLCPDCQRRSSTNPLRMFDCKVDRCQEVLQEAPLPFDQVCSECRKHFQQVEEILAQAGLEYSINKRMVRGLDYYQRTTFEVLSGEIGAQAAVAGGGRYDGLVKQLGGPDLPGIGFACGMDRMALLLDEVEPAKVNFFLAPLDPEALNYAHILAYRLRRMGYSVQAGFEAKSPKSHLRQANKLGVEKCILIGAQEMQQGTVMIKDMQSGQQTAVAGKDLDSYLKSGG